MSHRSLCIISTIIYRPASIGILHFCCRDHKYEQMQIQSFGIHIEFDVTRFIILGNLHALVYNGISVKSSDKISDVAYVEISLETDNALSNLFMLSYIS